MIRFSRRSTNKGCRYTEEETKIVNILVSLCSAAAAVLCCCNSCYGFPCHIALRWNLMVGKVKRVSYQSFLLISFLFIECLSFFFFLNWILIAFCKVSEFYPPLLRGGKVRVFYILHFVIQDLAHNNGVKDWRLRDLLAAFIPWVLRKRKVPEVHHLLLSNKGKAIMACVKCSQWYHFIGIAAASSIQEIFLHKGGQEN